MNKPPFWHLCSPKETSKLAKWVDEEMRLDQVKCPLNGEHRRAGRRLTNLSIILPSDRVEDIVWTWYSECLLTDRALKVFEACNFTGFEVKPVKAAFETPKKEPPRLWELTVTGWGGNAPLESGIRPLEHCEVCGYKTYSAWINPERLIDPTQWDGSDVFIVWPLPRHIFVTDHVRRAIKEQALTGITLEPISDLIFPQAVIPTLSPGRLSYWMPEPRARTLGIPLAIY